jgi:hypothetical protein
MHIRIEEEIHEATNLEISKAARNEKGGYDVIFYFKIQIYPMQLSLETDNQFNILDELWNQAELKTLLLKNRIRIVSGYYE